MFFFRWFNSNQELNIVRTRIVLSCFVGLEKFGLIDSD
jgi:hypothetical protein